MTEDEMVGGHHRLDGYEFEQAPEDGDGQGGLACCSPWGPKSLTRLSDSEQPQQRIIRECKSNFSLISVRECFYTNDKVSMCLREF